jgi:RNA polymerase sigma-70 factor, ECF subfamily
MLADAIASAVPGAAHEEEAELYRRFAPRVRLYGLKHLRDAAAAQDLVQQVFVVTLERLRRGDVRNAEAIGSFILGTSRTVAADHRLGAEQALTRRAAHSHVYAASGHVHSLCRLAR